jgi:hypothetical protein
MYGSQARRTSKFEPTQIRSSHTGERICYTLPSGRVYDLSTLRMHVVAKYEAYTNRTVGPLATIPSPCECLIQTLDVSVGGMQLNQINNYGQLMAAWSRYNTPSKEWGRRMVTSCARAALQPLGMNRQQQTYPAGSFLVIFNTWLGLLGSGARLDTGARGALEIEITMADKRITGKPLLYETFVTVDELPGGSGDASISFSDWRTTLSECQNDLPMATLQTNNVPGHHLQYVAATLLFQDHLDEAQATRPVVNLGFTEAFRHTSLGITSYRFDFDHNIFTHEVRYFEFLDRLREAMKGNTSSLELPLLMTADVGPADLRLEDLCDNIWLAGESVAGKGLPEGIVEVSFRTKAPTPLFCYVFLFAKYSCVF